MLRRVIHDENRWRHAVRGLAMLVILVLAATLPASGAMTGEPAEQQTRVVDDTDRRGDQTWHQAQLMRASRLIGTDVRNHRDRYLGEVWDVVLSRHDGQIAYLVVALDASLGLGETHVAVPWTRFESRGDGRFVLLDLDHGQLKHLTRFHVDGAWPLEAEWPFTEAAGTREDPVVLTVERGTDIPVELNQQLSSETTRAGEQFTLSVVDDIGVDGRVAVPRGSLVEGEVVEVQDARRARRPGKLVLRAGAIRIRGDSMPLDAAITADGKKVKGEGDLTDFDRDDLKNVGIGAAIGAAVGALIEGREGALAGVLIGGGGVFLARRGEEVTLPSGTPLLVELANDLAIRVPDR